MVDTNSQALRYLAEAYPDGIPEEDAAPLLALLRQRIGSTRTLSVVLALVAGGALSADHAASGSAPKAPLPQSDLRRVAARLVLGGWPLGNPPGDDLDDEDDTEPRFALLERRLTRGEVKKVAKALRRASIAPASPDDIAAAIADLTHSEATPDDLRRVRDRLAAKGWPVDFPDPGED